MDAYLDALIESEIGLGPWWLGLCGLALFFCAEIIARKARFAITHQQHMVIEGNPAIAKPFEPKYAVARLAFASMAFLAAAAVGEPALTLIGGGFVVAYAMGIGLNIHSLLFARALSRPGDALGTITLTPQFVMRDWGHRALGGATFLFASGVVFAHLALLGGALIFGLGAYRYLRNSRKLWSQP